MQEATQRERPVSPILERALRGKRLTRDDGYALLRAPEREAPALFDAARELRDRGHGRTVTFSAKIFLPLTTLCRDYCGYCTFRRDPGEPGGRTMEIDEVIALSARGAGLGAKEALFSLGDRPEALFPEHRAWLAARGYASTLGYLGAAAQAVVSETALLPHLNPGLMGERSLRALRPVSVSMGLMLESTSERLLEGGGPHERAPDKVPRRRLATLEAAGALRIPFTSGILIGIGETLEERVDALIALRDLHERHGHLQEIIVQNFRAKPTIRMSGHPDPSFDDLRKTLAAARLLLGARANLQCPPNLSPATYPDLIRAGLSDWGGVSPLTIDHINPEAPWPGLLALREATESAGYELRERLAVYPEYILDHPGFLDEGMKERAAALVGADGLVKTGLERWRHQ